jgi:hypothetical protein
MRDARRALRFPRILPVSLRFITLGPATSAVDYILAPFCHVILQTLKHTITVAAASCNSSKINSMMKQLQRPLINLLELDTTLGSIGGERDIYVPRHYVRLYIHEYVVWHNERRGYIPLSVGNAIEVKMQWRSVYKGPRIQVLH